MRRNWNVLDMDHNRRGLRGDGESDEGFYSDLIFHGLEEGYGEEKSDEEFFSDFTVDGFKEGYAEEESEEDFSSGLMFDAIEEGYALGESDEDFSSGSMSDGMKDFKDGDYDFSSGSMPEGMEDFKDGDYARGAGMGRSKKEIASHYARARKKYGKTVYVTGRWYAKVIQRCPKVCHGKQPCLSKCRKAVKSRRNIEMKRAIAMFRYQVTILRVRMNFIISTDKCKKKACRMKKGCSQKCKKKAKSRLKSISRKLKPWSRYFVIIHASKTICKNVYHKTKSKKKYFYCRRYYEQLAKRHFINLYKEVNSKK